MSLHRYVRDWPRRARVVSTLVLFSAVFGTAAVVNVVVEQHLRWLTPLPFLAVGCWLAITARPYASGRLLLGVLVAVGGCWLGYVVGNAADS